VQFLPLNVRVIANARLKLVNANIHPGFSNAGYLRCAFLSTVGPAAMRSL
jgi:hypothetical protein